MKVKNIEKRTSDGVVFEPTDVFMSGWKKIRKVELVYESTKLRKLNYSGKNLMVNNLKVWFCLPPDNLELFVRFDDFWVTSSCPIPVLVDKLYKTKQGYMDFNNIGLRFFCEPFTTTSDTNVQISLEFQSVGADMFYKKTGIMKRNLNLVIYSNNVTSVTKIAGTNTTEILIRRLLEQIQRRLD